MQYEELEMDEFLAKIKEEDVSIYADDSVFKEIFRVYEKVVIESLITAFALDFIKASEYGSVDTIRSVRDIGFKNEKHEAAYNNRGEYDPSTYHEANAAYKATIKEAKDDFNSRGNWKDDSYVPGNKVAYNKALPSERRAQLDHVLAAKGIHEDKGRVLSGLKGEDLANAETNLRFTNMNLNNNMKDKTVEEYIAWCEENPEKVNYMGKKGEPLPEEVKHQLREEYKQAKAAYEKKIAIAYYTSSDFWEETAKDAGIQGVKMGVSQVVGFVFAEVWIVTKEEVLSLPTGCSFPEIFTAVGVGIEKGFKSALSKYKLMIEKFGEGFLAGSLSSLATTLCSIFFKTSKMFVKNMRQIMASLTRSAGVLLINPDDLELGQRIKVSMIIMATGAATLAGSYVGVKVGEVVGGIPVVGGVITRFCSALVSGLLSCSFLLFMDRSVFINELVDLMNKIPTEVTDLQRISEFMEIYAARLTAIDLEQFKKDTEEYQDIAEKIEKADSEEELNNALKGVYKHFDLPWEGDFDEFMGNRNNQLVFS